MPPSESYGTRWAGGVASPHRDLGEGWRRTAVLSGVVTYSPEPVEPPADGEVLLCCSQPIGELALDL
ncbi:MAG: hypothetical protein ACRDRO_09695 [Pseudonocardiaceae bacterium]